MDSAHIKDIRFFWAATAVLGVALALILLPESIEQQVIGFGIDWGIWWYYLVDGGPLVLIVIGIYLMQKARGQV
jgi:hypothetical protein